MDAIAADMDVPSPVPGDCLTIAVQALAVPDGEWDVKKMAPTVFCGRVMSVTAHSDDEWDVVVRLFSSDNTRPGVGHLFFRNVVKVKGRTLRSPRERNHQQSITFRSVLIDCLLTSTCRCSKGCTFQGPTAFHIQEPGACQRRHPLYVPCEECL